MQAHSAFAYAARRRNLSSVLVGWLDPVAEPPPALACLGPRGDARLDRGRHQRRKQRVVFCCVIGAGKLPTALDEPHQASRSTDHHARHVFRLRRRQRQERPRGVSRARVDSVEHQAVEVRVEVERRTEALDEGNRRTLPVADAVDLLRTAPLVAEHAAQEHTQHGARQFRVPGARQPERVRHREHPLADGHLGQNPLDQVSRRVGHAPPAARRAEASPLARESDGTIAAAVVAAHAEEPVREDAAVEVGADLALDEPRYRRARLACLGEEGLELFADDLVEERLLGLVAFVLGHTVPYRDRSGRRPRRVTPDAAERQRKVSPAVTLCDQVGRMRPLTSHFELPNENGQQGRSGRADLQAVAHGARRGSSLSRAPGPDGLTRPRQRRRRISADGAGSAGKATRGRRLHFPERGAAPGGNEF